MNKIVREVGFLALGVAALLEACVYFDGTLLSLIVVLMGLYFAIDGLAWGHLEHLCAPREPAIVALTAEERMRLAQFEELTTMKSAYWWRDFLALMCATIALGFAVHALKTSQHHLADHPESGLSMTEKIRFPAVMAATALGACFVLARSYWIRLGASGKNNLLGMADRVWGKNVDRWAPRYLLIVAILCFTVGALAWWFAGERWWRAVVASLLFLLDAAYLMGAWRRI